MDRDATGATRPVRRSKLPVNDHAGNLKWLSKAPPSPGRASILSQGVVDGAAVMIATLNLPQP
jgi:hypothetical protein